MESGIPQPADPTPPVLARPVQAPAAPLSPLRLDGISRGHAALDLSLVFVVGVVVQFVPGALAWSVESDSPFGPSHAFVVAMKWADAALVAALLAYFVLRNRIAWSAFGLRMDRPLGQLAWTLAALAGGYGAMIVGMIAIAMLWLFSPALQQDLQRRVEFMGEITEFTWGSTAALFAAVAIHEEILFRALMIPYLRRITRSWTAAVAISSALFASLHFPQGWTAVLQIFGLSLAFGAVFVASRSLLALITAHFIFNFAQTFLMRLIDLDQMREILNEAG